MHVSSFLHNVECPASFLKARRSAFLPHLWNGSCFPTGQPRHCCWNSSSLWTFTSGYLSYLDVCQVPSFNYCTFTSFELEDESQLCHFQYFLVIVMQPDLTVW